MLKVSSLALLASLAGSPVLAAHPGHPSTHAEAPPPHAKPGQCFARVTLPARVEHYQEQVLVEEGREVQSVVPPRFAPRTHEVVVREESRRYEVSEPVYETVPETVLVRPGYEKTWVEPAEVRTVHETVTVEPARLAWKLVRSPLQPAPVWCLIEEPAKTAVVARSVVVRPETVRTVSVPPETKVIPRDVLRRPAQVREVIVPPLVKPVVVEEMVEPARVEVHRTPPRFAPVTKTRVVEPERGEWVQVLCEADANPHRIKAMQGALARRGYYKGPVDGLYGPATADAVRRFQHDQALPHGGYLSLPTLHALEGPPRSHAVPRG
jgi:hypothetical protein